MPRQAKPKTEALEHVPQDRLSEIVKNQRASALASHDGISLMEIIQSIATRPDFDIDKLQKLLEFKERLDANEARKAYTLALAAFKADPPTIRKNKHVHFDTDCLDITLLRFWGLYQVV
jgi:hypothetical protein